MSSQTSITKETIEGLKETIRDLYLSDDIPWVIGYSGGKDSTAALQLVWMAIAELPEPLWRKDIHVINTDTLVESPVVSKWARTSLEHMDRAAKELRLPLKTHILHPAYDNTFWVNLLGRGYPFPRKKFRWCTDRLKIEPVNTFIKNKIAEHGEVILVIGTRKAESESRRRHMEYYETKRVRELLSPNPTLANELVFSPLEDWEDDDVWLFLMQYRNPWGYSNNNLLTLYRGATKDNECPIMYEKDLPTCGKSRFGCWVCTMVERDKSMEAMITNDDEKAWMSPMLEFRDEFGSEEGDRERRLFRRRQGHLSGSYQRLYHGPYTRETRHKWLRRLLEVQEEVRELSPEEYSNIELISIPELQAIRRIWVEENHEFEDALPEIYESVTHKQFHDPTWISSAGFQKEEWNVLEDICKRDEYSSEELLFEMAYSLIDIENHKINQNQRAGLLEELEAQIRKTFYKNEDDALEYYTNKMNRKKELGGKYNEKFMQSYVKEYEAEYDANSSSDTESEEVVDI